MVATLNIEEQHKVGLASQQTMIDLQAGADHVQAWRGWNMQTVSMPQSNSSVQKNTVALPCGGELFSQEMAFE